MFQAYVPTFTVGRTVQRGLVAAIAMLVICVPAGLAQTPVGEATPVGDAESHPAHIHTGTCDELGDVVFPLENVTAEVGDAVGADSAHPVKTSRSFVDVSLDDIIAGEHAVNVHLSDAEIGTYIACGDIGGVLMEEGGRTHLIIGLGELNDSGHSGIVWFGEDGDQTEVVVTLIEPDELD